MTDKTVKSLNTGWKFCIGDNWDDSNAESVCLPHCVKLTPANSSGCRNYQGLCHYKKIQYIPDGYAGKKVFLEFEGAMGVSTLYINGSEVKKHYCGYTPFKSDISGFLNYGQDNEIHIVLDNSDNPEVPPGKPQKELDFSYDGGLYRKAEITVCESLYITDPMLADEIAGGGIFVWYTNVSEKSAEVNFRVHIQNDFDYDKSYGLRVGIFAPTGEKIGEYSLKSELKACKNEYSTGKIVVDNPMLWSPETPNLYVLKAALEDENGGIYSESINIGIRSFKFTVNDGVIFNGRSRRFNSANYHQTWPYIGNSVPDSLLIRDIMKIKEAGFDNIRSHYPFCRTFLETCSKIGITLIVSNPGWQFFQKGIFEERAQHNMRDIVRIQRNYPCVLLWEPILNESEMDYDTQKGFHDVVHSEFPYEPCYTASDYGPTDVEYCEYDPGMLGKGMEKYGLVERRDFTERPRWIREYGDAPDNFFDQNSIWRSPRRWGDSPMVQSVDRMLQRFDNGENSGQYINVYNDKRLCGYGIWPVISHNRGYHINPCWGGHLDLFRIPKFSYWFVKSQQDRSTAGDILYIANWWTESSPSDVTVFSNAQKVRLYFNDVLVAEQAPDELQVKHPPFTFKDVKRKYKSRNRSVLKAEAIVDGKVVAIQQVKAPGVATHLKLEADFMNIPLKADGSDIVALRCHLLDKDENIVPLSSDAEPIIFKVAGEGKIIGGTDIGANPVCAEAGTATVLIQSTEKAGKITVTAEMYWAQYNENAIKPAQIEIFSEGVPSEEII